MNFNECKDVCELYVCREDLRNEYHKWVNRALRSIQEDNNWFCMRHEEEVTMPSGNTSVALPDDFKELTNARPPIFLKGADNRWMPCDVQRSEELYRRDAALILPRSTQTLTRRGPDLFLSTDGDTWAFNTIDVLTGDCVFKVSYFRILPDLVNADDTNYLTRAYEEMVTNKIKSIAFEAINDPIAADFEKLYELKKTKAVLSDSRRWLAGRRLQMGG